ncbi:S8 family serine peptidase [Yinghuangia aomiensis]
MSESRPAGHAPDRSTPRFWRRARRRTGLRGLAAAITGCLLATVPAPTAHADSIRATQWYLAGYQLEAAWRISQGAGVTVAVVDTGVRGSHPDLKGQLVPGIDLVTASGDGAVDDAGHGTMVASVVVASGVGDAVNHPGPIGVAPKAKVMPVRVFATGDTYGVMSGQTAAAIRYAANSDARIINLSYGAGYEVPTEKAAVDYAISRGKLVIAAVGNVGAGEDYTSTESYPAGWPGVLGVGALAVGAVPGKAERLPQSTRSSAVAISAPGQSMVAACTGKTGYCRNSGSSFAAPFVAGVAALVWSVHPDWTANQVIWRLIDTAVQVPLADHLNNDVGFGSVHPLAALTSTADPGPADVNPLVGVRGAPRYLTPATPTPSPSAPTPVAPAPSPDPVLEAAPAATGSDTWLWLLAGSTAAGGLAAVSVALWRRRRRTNWPPPNGA